MSGSEILDRCAAGACGRPEPRQTECAWGGSREWRLVHDACARDAHDARKAERAAQLAAEPRCEVEGCTHRATFAATATDGPPVGLCGWHLRRARRRHARAASKLGGLALFMPMAHSRAHLLASAGTPLDSGTGTKKT